MDGGDGFFISDGVTPLVYLCIITDERGLWWKGVPLRQLVHSIKTGEGVW